ncbi:Coenzyme F420 hydrogenase/dehydrogenase, beta subunit C-terminal domain [Massilimicrobiota sp. SW1139]|uniref:Coenzyme F420 hydrogenase/dehydrogenase, beta subunit C-terminal domain n=1 Tax=Massilimicrobiota sp. SW1139 TaxID=2530043 RepID=UPI00143A2395|nr:Coenzyme F420 hydrogenase/dehydrogenase, beta subunit C-terminal domain [Massilimicrobiota sp. SW1139]NJE45757.1 4Fe-4S dicluster domain-containing protein [Massilimicrobiota sp. SW1139]
MIILFNEKKNCCGCGACENICPKKAISMKEDEYGFIYPEINHNLCIECHLCEKVCHFQSRSNYSKDHMAYAAVTKNQEILMNSTSGGIFTTLALEFIKDGGYVSGSIYDGDFNVVHIVSNKIEDVYKMQGSKYVQSSINDAYLQIKKLLLQKEKVLFSGTPCQVDGLYGFLQRDYDNLYTIDIVCHGVPNNKMFKDYLNYETKKYGKITEIKFRDKTQGWGTKGSIKFENKKKIIYSGTSEYYYLFNKSLTFRDSCYKCKYSSHHRPANITIGDYWGIEKMDFQLLNKKEIDIDKGISLIICNNEQGNDFLEKYKFNFNIYLTTLDNVSKFNHNLNQPSILPSKRNKILNMYGKSFDFVAADIACDLKKEKYKFMIKKIVPSKMKIIIKRFLKKG